MTIHRSLFKYFREKISSLFRPIFNFFLHLTFKNRSKKPEVFIGGAMKAGTTSMFQYLARHPELVPPKVKEPCYFAYNYRKGILWYYDQFENIGGKSEFTRYFDASPVYLHDPRSAKRIFNYSRNVRLIFLLRDPIERTYSHFNYYSSKDSMFAIKNPHRIETRTFEEAVLDDVNGIEERLYYKYCRLSKYFEQLERYFQYFNREQLHIIDFTDFKSDPKTVLANISLFLGLNDHSIWESFVTSGDKVLSADSLKFQDDLFLKVFNAQNYEIAISDETRELLVRFFKEDVKKLTSKFQFRPNWASVYLD